jgi:hypothetical protein
LLGFGRTWVRYRGVWSDLEQVASFVHGLPRLISLGKL